MVATAVMGWAGLGWECGKEWGVLHGMMCMVLYGYGAYVVEFRRAKRVDELCVFVEFSVH